MILQVDMQVPFPCSLNVLRFSPKGQVLTCRAGGDQQHDQQLYVLFFVNDHVQHVHSNENSCVTFTKLENNAQLQEWQC
jgi:hypothetical protein